MKPPAGTSHWPLVLLLLSLAGCGGPALRGTFKQPGDRGRIESFIENVRGDTLTVTGVKVLVPAGTRVRRQDHPGIRPRDLRPGWEISAEVDWLGEGLFRARSVEVRNRRNPRVEFDCILQSIQNDRLRADGRWVEFSSQTIFEYDGGRLAPEEVKVKLKAGTNLTVRGTERDDRTIAADRIVIIGYGLDSVERRFVEIGTREARQIRGQMEPAADPDIQAYVARVGESLVPEYADDLFDFNYTVVRDPALNAFALPDGSVFVHTGLLARLENEAQLACVLGHESVHVIRRHAAEQYEGRSKYDLLALGLQIGAEILGTQVGDNLLRNTIYAAADLASSAAVNGYGRELEDEADRIGLVYTWDAGYDIREAPHIWEIFSRVTGDVSEIENFFYGNHSTHTAREDNLDRLIALDYRAAIDSRRLERRGPEYLDATVGAVLMTAIDDYKLGRLALARSGFEKVLAIRPGDPTAAKYIQRLNETKQR